MTICYFFSKGQCKFGANCRYEHVLPTNSNADARNMSNFTNNAPSTNSNFNYFQHQTDNNAQHRSTPCPLPRRWHGARIWPFSAVASANDCRAGNDVDDDFSQEELRAQAYLNRKNGTADNVVNDEFSLLMKHQAVVAPALLAESFASDLSKVTQNSKTGNAAATSSLGFNAPSTKNPFGVTNVSAPSNSNVEPMSSFSTFSMLDSQSNETASMIQPDVGMGIQQPSPVPVDFKSSSAQLSIQPQPVKLTSQQRSEFEAEKFSLGNVPEVAPPLELLTM